MRTALTVAGSDSGGGAGIQADLKSFAAIGVHGTSVVTCVTSQNTRAVTSIFPLPAAHVRAQLRAVLDDFDVRGAKTGMLYSAEIVAAVAEDLAGTNFPVVVDPVMVATVGASLQRDGFRDALVERLLGQAALVTPNRHEAEALTGQPVRDVSEMEAAARAIHALGARAVLVKGGHVAGTLVDVFYDGRVLRRLEGHRYDKELHGAGCTLAASIAAYLAQGRPLLKAVESARRRVARGFATSYRAGQGVEIINSSYHPDRFTVAHDLDKTASGLAADPGLARVSLGLHLAYALPAASRPDEIAYERLLPIPGRGLARSGIVDFGAPPSIANSLLAAMREDPETRASIGLSLATRTPGRPRRGRPEAARRVEKGAGVIPGVDADVGGNREGMTMRVLGRNPEDVARKLRRLARTWNR